MEKINRRILLCTCACLFLFSKLVYTQIAINETGIDAVSSAILDVQSTNKGMLVPRMRSNQRTAITAPALGLLVFDTDTNTFWFHTDTWQELTTGMPGTIAEADGKVIISSGVGIGVEEVTAKLHVMGSADDTSVLKVEGASDYANTTDLGPIGVNARAVIASGNSGQRGIAGNFEGGLIGLSAKATTLYGVLGTSENAAGIFGSSLHGYGVQGSADNETAGVYGYGINNSAGIKGAGTSIGVLGESSNYWGVVGFSTGGASIAAGLYGRATEGIGVFGRTDNENSYAGYFAGDLYSSGNYIGSDAALKQNEQTITDAMNVLVRLQPKSYTYRTSQFRDLNLPEGTRYGMIAQEVESVLPQLVKETSIEVYDWNKFDTETAHALENEKPTPNAPKTLQTVQFKAVNYTEFIPILIAGVQEQQANIQNLTQTNAALQNEVNVLKTALQSLQQTVQQLSEEDNR